LHKQRIDKVIEGIEKEKDAYRKLIDEQLKTIENEEKLRSYKSDVEEATKKVTDIERQIAALSLDNSASANAKKKQLQEDLLNARKELEELQYQHSVEMQKEALETEYENFENEKDSEIKRAIFDSATRKILAVDSSKFDKISFVRVGNISDVDVIVTDTKPASRWIDFLEEKNVELIY